MTDLRTYAEINYEDGSGPRMAVRDGIELSDDGRAVRIVAVGGDVLVHPEDIDALVVALRQFQIANQS